MHMQLSFYTARGDSTGLHGASHVVYLLTGMRGTLGPVSVPANTGAGFIKGSVTDCNARSHDLGELIKLQVWLTDKVGQVRGLEFSIAALKLLAAASLGLFAQSSFLGAPRPQGGCCLRPV